MEIFLCGSCGNIGSKEQLCPDFGSTHMKFDDIIKKNYLYKLCCPGCKSTDIYMKYIIDPVPINIPTMWLPQEEKSLPSVIITNTSPRASVVNQPVMNQVLNEMSKEEDIIPPEILAEALDSAAMKLNDLIKPGTQSKKPKEQEVRPNRNESTKIRVKKTCDMCNKEFPVKPGDNAFGGQCPSCLKATIKKYVG